MKLIIKQKIFKWFDTFEVYNEKNEVMFEVKGRFSIGHKLEIYNNKNMHIATIKECLFRFFSEFNIYINEEFIGSIKRKFSLFKPKYHINYMGWIVEGDIFGWNYTIKDGIGNHIATIDKEILEIFRDVYVIDVVDNDNILNVLMLVIAIDAEKCSKS